MSGPRRVATGDRWRPTAAHLRAVGGGTIVATAAVLLGRPDLLVLATPLLVVALWSTAPGRSGQPLPAVRHSLTPDLLSEGQSSQWMTHVDYPDDVEHVVVSLEHDAWLEVPVPVHGTGTSGDRSATTWAPTVQLTTPVRPTRWGRRRAGPATVSLTSRWASHQLVGVAQSVRTLTVLPQPAVFDSRAPLPHPAGLVGPDRGRRISDGTEFFGIRAFTAGDRLRRVHWPVSLRTGTLQVVTTNADQDSEVAVVVDAFSDLRVRQQIALSSRGRRGVRRHPAPATAESGMTSSLTVSVRAAGALAEHHLRRGDRVGLTVVGGDRPLRVPTGVGRRHLLRVLHGLAAVEPPARAVRTDTARTLPVMSAGAVVVVMTPLLRPEMVALLLSLAGRGLTVVAVDTLATDGVPPPQDLGLRPTATDPWLPLAWRLRRLERAITLRQLMSAGVPVVAWQGPGSLDYVLRTLSARSGRSRMVRR